MGKNKQLLKKKHSPQLTAIEFIKYIGPGFLVTVGFIDPGNWASNMSAGSTYGYSLLWVVTLGTVFLIILQHNAAHLGIVTGYCLSEAATFYIKPWISRSLLGTAMVASVSTALAEILGGAIALNMLFKLPIRIGALLILAFVLIMLFTNSYKRLEKWIIGFVSLIALSFIIELFFVNISWDLAIKDSFVPKIPNNSIIIIMSILGAVVMPHNLFLHSEMIQSRQWNLEDEKVRVKQLKYEFMDTIFSMLAGWAINCAIIIIAAATFYTKGTIVSDLSQAQQMLKPLLGSTASIIFAMALLLAGIASLITAAMAGGSTFTGIFGEPYDIKDPHTKLGVALTMVPAAILVMILNDPFKMLLYSQMILSIQLPFTIFLQIYLTSSKRVMGGFKNSWLDKILLYAIGIIVLILNLFLLGSFLL